MFILQSSLLGNIRRLQCCQLMQQLSDVGQTLILQIADIKYEFYILALFWRAEQGCKELHSKMTTKYFLGFAKSILNKPMILGQEFVLINTSTAPVFAGIMFPNKHVSQNCVFHFSPLRSDAAVTLKNGDLVKVQVTHLSVHLSWLHSVIRIILSEVCS